MREQRLAGLRPKLVAFASKLPSLANYQERFESLDLAAIAKVIDFEKACNLGLYQGQISDAVKELNEKHVLAI